MSLNIRYCFIVFVSCTKHDGQNFSLVCFTAQTEKPWMGIMDKRRTCVITAARLFQPMANWWSTRKLTLGIGLSPATSVTNASLRRPTSTFTREHTLARSHTPVTFVTNDLLSHLISTATSGSMLVTDHFSVSCAIQGSLRNTVLMPTCPACTSHQAAGTQIW